MSLCLALLLAVVAIDWWHGWKPFTRPFQMPENQWLKRLQPFTASAGDRPCAPDRSSTRESRRASRLGGSHRLPGIRLQGRVREGVSTFDLADDGRE
jgi:hypothetical protein